MCHATSKVCSEVLDVEIYIVCSTFTGSTSTTNGTSSNGGSKTDTTTLVVAICGTVGGLIGAAVAAVKGIPPIAGIVWYGLFKYVRSKHISYTGNV